MIENTELEDWEVVKVRLSPCGKKLTILKPIPILPEDVELSLKKHLGIEVKVTPWEGKTGNVFDLSGSVEPVEYLAIRMRYV